MNLEILDRAEECSLKSEALALDSEWLAALTCELRALRLTYLAAETPEQRSDASSTVPEGWYRIELMGHRRRDGHIRPISLAGRQMVEICEPAHTVDTHDEPRDIPESVEVYAAAAIFSLQPSSEDDILETLRERDGIPF